ncbi:hypothetical protein ITP53_05570 [Nonomuraea sp. K274]|uniref:Uncharacterized protein n=1 Tax=Nonomuraea cypriaca TaxID=1187855 RepID=A0A931A2U7_9ACTN|nr:hypothetical protein [Nonomuraea cypriaca]MBF8185217.1 hypothetical protein [Nonomuraea cypriaca]
MLSERPRIGPLGQTEVVLDGRAVPPSSAMRRLAQCGGRLAVTPARIQGLLRRTTTKDWATR